MESTQVEGQQTQPAQTESNQVQPEKVVASQIQPTQEESVKTGSEPTTQTQPTQTEPVQVGAANVDLATQTQPTQTEPAKTDSASVEPAKLEGAPTEQEAQTQDNQGETDRKRLIAMSLEIDALNEKVGGGGEKQKKSTLSHDEKMEYEENAKLQKMVSELRETLREKNLTLVRKNLETEALEIQITALKEVTILSKGMLDIRNTENLQLKDQIDSMQEKVTAERERHNSMLQKAEKAASINTELQAEYHKQCPVYSLDNGCLDSNIKVKLFGDLKESYEKKLIVLQGEIKRLEGLQNSTPP